MFLLNSRDPLVTATCDPRLSPKTAGTPSPEVTGPICRVPSPPVSPTRLSLLSQGTSVGSRYGHGTLSPIPLSRSPELEGTRTRRAHTVLARVLAITALPRARTVRWGGDPTPPIRRRRDGMRTHEGCTRIPWRRNINRLPIRTRPFGVSLGPANSWPTARRQENLALSAAGVFTRLGCYYRQDLQRRSVHGTSRPRFRPTSAPAYRPPSTGG